MLLFDVMIYNKNLLTVLLIRALKQRYTDDVSLEVAIMSNLDVIVNDQHVKVGQMSQISDKKSHFYNYYVYKY